MAPAGALQVAAFYAFAPMEDLAGLQGKLLAEAQAGQVFGTLLLADEGVNGTVCGPEMAVQDLLSLLRRQPGLEGLTAKLSWAPEQAFHRLKVRLKREIVTMGCPTVKPQHPSAPGSQAGGSPVGTYVRPQDWDGLIANPDTLVIDTRNAYEVAVGSFEGAVDPGTESFRQFPAWVEEHLRPWWRNASPRPWPCSAPAASAARRPPPTCCSRALRGCTTCRGDPAIPRRRAGGGQPLVGRMLCV